MRAKSWTGWAAALGVCFAMACGGNSTSTADPNGGAGVGGTGGGPGGTGGTGGLVGCSGPDDCGDRQFCSASGFCISEGSCDAKADCDSGSFCSVTKACIPEGTCAGDGDCEAGYECDANQQCVVGGGCGTEEFVIEAVPPNMMIVLDRSCSMRRDLDNTLNPPGPNKWTYAVAALNQLTDNFRDQIRWGLILFPDITGGNCRQDAPAVPVGPGTEDTIQTLLNNALDQNDENFPDFPCVTNIDTAIEQASQQTELTDPARANYAVLITDGKQAGCDRAGGDNGTTQILTDMHANGISTFVVGFGGDAIDPAQMDIFAVAGGVPRAGTPSYYQADDAAQLEQALDTIGGSVVGCTFSLGDVPPNPDDLYVFFDNLPVPRDTSGQEGWDYDPVTNQITFYGNSCDQLKSQQVSDIDVVFGCPIPTPA